MYVLSYCSSSTSRLSIKKMLPGISCAQNLPLRLLQHPEDSTTQQSRGSCHQNFWHRLSHLALNVPLLQPGNLATVTQWLTSLQCHPVRKREREKGMNKLPYTSKIKQCKLFNHIPSSKTTLLHYYYHYYYYWCCKFLHDYYVQAQ